MPRSCLVLSAVLASSLGAHVKELTTVLRRRFSALPRQGRRHRDPASDRARQALALLDAEASGAIDMDEWKTGIHALLRYRDRDIDGRWSRAELNIAAKGKPGGR